VAPLPLPGSKPPNLPPLEDEQLNDVWRLHWESDCRKPDKHPTGKWRFDAPVGEYQVTYVNQDRHAIFAEVFGDSGEVSPRNLGRRCSRMSSTRLLRLIPLDDAIAVAALHTDIRISGETDYDRTMQWSLALHQWYPSADGIRYLGRHALQYRNYCLFLDRCRRDLNFSFEGELEDRRDHVMTACDRFNLAPRIFDKRGSGWP
jgi:hypothetical protein